MRPSNRVSRDQVGRWDNEGLIGGGNGGCGSGGCIDSASLGDWCSPALILSSNCGYCGKSSRAMSGDLGVPGGD